MFSAMVRAAHAELSEEAGSTTALVFVEVEKFYDTLSWATLLQEAMALGMPAVVLRWF